MSSDSVWVTLRVLTAHKDTVAKICTAEGYPSDEDNGDNVWWEFGFDSVSYGTLQFLHVLRAKGIAYDANWQRGSEYNEGTESLRFTSDGSAVIKIIYDSSYNPDIHELMQLIDNHSALRQYLINHVEKCSVIPLDDSQIQYGKTAMARQLVIMEEMVEHA